MKKIILFAISFSCGLLHQLNAQDRLLGFGFHVESVSSSVQIQDDEYIDTERDAAVNAGIDVYLQFSEDVQLRTGLFYRLQSVGFKDYNLVLPCDLNNPQPDPYDTYFSMDADLNYVGVPIMSRWRLVGQRTKLFVEGGLDAMFKVSESTEVLNVDCSDTETVVDNFPKSFSSMVINGRLGLAVDVGLTDHVSLVFQPMMATSFNSITKQDELLLDGKSARFLDYGIFVGLRF